MQKQKNTVDENCVALGSAPLGKMLLKYATPCVLSMLVSSLYNICDQIFIGHSELGYLGNAATSVVFPLTVVAMAVSLCYGDGAAAYLSLSQGKGKTDKIHKSVGNSLLVTLVVSVLLVVIGFACMTPLLRLLGATDDSLPLAIDYFRIILAGFPIFMIGSCLGQIIRADGAPKVAMTSMVSGALTNIILDPIFIYPWGLNLGIKGAAYATVLGQVVTAVITWWYLGRSQAFKLQKSSFMPDGALLQENSKLGISTFISQMAIVAIAIVTNISLARHGAESVYGVDIPIAVFGIVMKVFTIVISFAIGISVGAQPIYGYNYGAGNYERVKKLYQLVIICMLVVGLIGTLIFQLAPDLVIGIFGSQSPEYVEFAQKTIRIFLMLVAATCIVRATSITFQAVGKPIQAAITSLSRDIIAFIPLCLILPEFLGIDGVLYAAPIADAFGFVLAVALAIPFFRRLGKSELDDNGKPDYAPCLPE